MKSFASLILAVLCMPATGFGQGTLIFITGDLDEGPFITNGGIVRYDSSFLGQIYAGPDPDNLTPIGAPARFGLRDGVPDARADGLVLDGSTLTVATVAGGEIGYYQLRGWCGFYPDFDTAVWNLAPHSETDIVRVQFGDEAAGIASPTTDGFTSGSTFLAHVACVPEPSVIALGLLGLGGLCRSRRRHERSRRT